MLARLLRVGDGLALVGAFLLLGAGSAAWVWAEAGWKQGMAVLVFPVVVMLLVLFWHPDDPTL